MSKNNLFKFILFCTAIIFSTSFSAESQKKQISLEDIWLKNTFRSASVPGFNVLNDGKRYVKTEKNGDIKIYNLSNQKEVGTILKAASLRFENEKIDASNFEFSPDEKKLLLLAEADPIYRHSTLYKVFVYDISTQTIQLLSREKVLHASFSPDGSKVAYVQNNNLYIKTLNNELVEQVSSDGLKNQIINGNCDWVYEEEFGFTKAFQWSPKGNYIAYYRFDESKVKEYTIPFYKGDTYPDWYTYKYPKAGEDNSIVGIKIYNLNTKLSQNVDLGNEIDQYIPRIKWTNSENQLCISRLNRHQNQLELLLADANNGSSTIIYEEKNKYYIDITDNLTFLPDGKSFVISSEKDGSNQLYKWDWTTNKSTQLTNNKDEIRDVIGIGVSASKIFYTVAENTINTAFYVLDLKSGKSKKLSIGDGTHTIQACNGLRYFVDYFSMLSTVPKITLIDEKGKTVRVLEDNAALTNKLGEYDFSTPSLLTIPNKEGLLLNAYMIKPSDFDATKKYPVLMYQYSGPGSQQVLNKFPLDNYWWHQLLAEKGYIIVVADGTGTGGRGEEFKKKTYLELGNQESNDQIAVATWLSEQSYVDAKRIGIWGWSFGGFMSSTCILKAPNLFKAAIAVAPVTNWRFYDNIYTERFMRTPAENKKGYDDNAPLSMTKNLKGNFLLIHGLADDNVHFQNAAELAKNLVNANKNFDAFYYPNKNHSIYGGYTRYNLYVKMTNFILEKL